VPPPVLDGVPPDDVAPFPVGTAWLTSSSEGYVLKPDLEVGWLDPRHHPDLTTLTATQRLALLETT
jgi:hypothetical protein